MGFVTISFLEREYAESPVPVFECDNRYWRKWCEKKNVVNSNGLGAFFFGPDLKSSFIRICDNLPIYKRLCVFYHEVSHAECYGKKCFCFKEQNKRKGICEHHANIGCLTRSIKSGMNKTLSCAVESLKAFSSDIPTKLIVDVTLSIKGAKLTIEHPIWQSALGHVS
jgi:hypothetical protein